MRNRAGLRGIVLTTICIALGAVFTADADPSVPPGMERVYYDAASPDGSLRGGSTLRPFVDPALLLAVDAPPAAVTTILNQGPSSNRLDVVFLGDGYRSSDLNNYAQHVQRTVDALFSTIPFSYYKPYFNVHRVSVISNESGVDNDPNLGVMKDTALDMGFWCNGIDRLLCVDVAKAYAFAANAPAADLLYVLANSSQYGGAAYVFSRLATFAGFHPSAPEIAIHETGHSLSNLADEYETGGSVNYFGPERTEPNASIHNAETMAALGVKWHLWLRELGGVLDGPVDTYLGCLYSHFGIYRPSPNSRMRALHNPFNAPSVEALIVSIYQRVRPIDALFPPTSTIVPLNATLTVTPVRPQSHALTIQWYIDGQPIPGAHAESLALASINIPQGADTVSVKVWDDTPMVRNPSARELWLSQTAQWSLIQPPCPADINGDGVVNFPDLNILLIYFGQPVTLGVRGDINGDGVVDFLDLNILLASFGQVC